MWPVVFYHSGAHTHPLTHWLTNEKLIASGPWSLSCLPPVLISFFSSFHLLTENGPPVPLRIRGPTCMLFLPSGFLCEPPQSDTQGYGIHNLKKKNTKRWRSDVHEGSGQGWGTLADFTGHIYTHTHKILISQCLVTPGCHQKPISRKPAVCQCRWWRWASLSGL